MLATLSFVLLVPLFLLVGTHLTLSSKQRAKASSGGIIDFSKLTGDIVPSTYPVFKFNQNVSNDSTFSELHKKELCALQDEILRLMPQQRQNFEHIQTKLERQITLVDELATAMERQ